MKANGVDVIVAGSFPTTLACKVAKVPTVVFFVAGDPVATRLIEVLRAQAATSPAFLTTQ
jgi:hypothetical protein